MDEFDTLMSVLTGIVLDPEAPSFIIVIDGLDECPNRDLRRLLDGLEELLPRPDAGGVARSLRSLKILMLSRPENMIKNVLKRQHGTIRLKGEDEVVSISKDVALMIQYRMAHLAIDGIPGFLLDDFADGLIERADNTFLWMSLVLKILQDHTRDRGGASRNELLELLRNRDIYFVYNHLLGKVASPKDTQRMLHMILAATEPLTVQEMAIALASSRDHRTLDDFASNIRYPFEDYIHSLGRHFIRIIRSKIYLVHQTAREFLVGLSEQHQPQVMSNHGGYGPWQHSITTKESHATLLEACVSYLSCGERSSWVPMAFPDSLQGMLGSSATAPGEERESPFRNRDYHMVGGPSLLAHQSTIHSHPFFRYASGSWPLHFRMVKPGGTEYLLSQATDLCRLIPRNPVYPIWAAPIGQAKPLGGDYWISGERQSQFSRQVRVLFALGIHEITTRIIGPSPLQVDGPETLLHLAAALGSRQDLLWLLSLDCFWDINKQDSQSETVLNIALQRSGFQGIPEKLLSRGARVDIRGHNGQTPLHVLATLGTSPYDLANLVHILVSKGASVDARDSDGSTPLLLAGKAGNRSLIRALLDHNPDVNVRDAEGITIIQKAADFADAGLLRTLLRRGADVHVQDKAGNSPWSIIQRRQTLDPSIAMQLRYFRRHVHKEKRLDNASTLLNSGIRRQPGRNPDATPFAASPPDVATVQRKRYAAVFDDEDDEDGENNE